ncbi:MAG: divalent-cation tolerance protein CutA [Zoogloeaceae bacterium]|jgi:periplasmic divalent cation tolerance protein|nr:divalent-cation tolerance protein CutA [Zoogloeaceae bacterium]
MAFDADFLLVLTTLPDAQSARQMAAALVERRLAACVHVLARCRSVFLWKGNLEETDEIPLHIKTSAKCYAALEAFIRKNHPYELPEIVALPLTNGLPAYFHWLETETNESDAEKHVPRKVLDPALAHPGKAV